MRVEELRKRAVRPRHNLKFPRPKLKGEGRGRGAAAPAHDFGAHLGGVALTEREESLARDVGLVHLEHTLRAAAYGRDLST